MSGDWDVTCAILQTTDERADRLLRQFPMASPMQQGAEHVVRRRKLAQALLQDLLNRAIGRGPWTIVSGENGKPLIAERAGEPAFGISLTHGGNLVGVAISNIGAVGLDIEPHGRERDLAGIARYAFGPREQQTVAQGGVTAFYRIWTLREAIGKATGEGLALVTDGIDRIASGPEEGAWAQDDGRWLLLHRHLGAASLALAVRACGPAAAARWSSARIRWEGLA